MLVTGKDTGESVNMRAPASGSTIAVMTDQPMIEAAAFLPFMSLPSEATAGGNVRTITGIVMKMPRSTRNEESPERIPAAADVSPKSSAVASPMRTAAMYVIHVFIGKAYSTDFQPSIFRLFPAEKHGKLIPAC